MTSLITRLNASVCKFCGKEKPLIEAHIVPRAFMKVMSSPKGPFKSVMKDLRTSPHPAYRPVRSDHVRRMRYHFSPWENYTARLLYRIPTRYYERRSPNDFYFLVPKYDYRQLKLCMLSIFWKMSVSTRPVFAGISAAPHSARLKRMLTTADPGEPNDFATVMLHLTGYFGEGTMLGPQRAIHPTTVFNIGMPRYLAAIKVSRGWDHPLSNSTVMRPDVPLFVGLKEFVPDEGWIPKFNQIWERAQAEKRKEERKKKAVKRP